ncbi:unnamed protein product, partial [Brassica rapa subsp. trilocularis]
DFNEIDFISVSPAKITKDAKDGKDANVPAYGCGLRGKAKRTVTVKDEAIEDKKKAQRAEAALKRKEKQEAKKKENEEKKQKRKAAELQKKQEAGLQKKKKEDEAELPKKRRKKRLSYRRRRKKKRLSYSGLRNLIMRVTSTAYSCMKDRGLTKSMDGCLIM